MVANRVEPVLFWLLVVAFHFYSLCMTWRFTLSSSPRPAEMSGENFGAFRILHGVDLTVAEGETAEAADLPLLLLAPSLQPSLPCPALLYHVWAENMGPLGAR